MHKQTINTTNVIWWLQPDSLRLDDQPLLAQIPADSRLLVVFCPSLQHEWLDTGFARRSRQRLAFEQQGLAAFDQAMRERGQQLFQTEQPALDALPKLAQALNATVITTKAHGDDESRQIIELKAALTQQNSPDVIIAPGNGLFTAHDLPFDPNEPPGIFSQFRRQVERAQTPVAKPVPIPATLPALPKSIPATALAFTPTQHPPLRFTGGEIAANQALQDYLADEQAVLHYKQTRNALMGKHQSSQLSPWLAQGSLSVRRFWDAINHFEQTVAANESTYWLKFELLWREFFRWIADAHGAKLFHWRGLAEQNPRGEQHYDLDLLARWQRGETGFGLVDAGMRELAQTGFASNRARQNMASCLIHELGLDWRLGAAWFEHCLLDYDVASNWGNWCYLAGVGNDPRPQRRFNLTKQAAIYDPHGLYQQLASS